MSPTTLERRRPSINLEFLDRLSTFSSRNFLSNGRASWNFLYALVPKMLYDSLNLSSLLESFLRLVPVCALMEKDSTILSKLTSAISKRSETSDSINL